jgi:dihydroorotate dehydrogenase (NAD+) catalytic subunit
MEIGQDAELVAAITRAVVDAAGVPVIVKLSAMLPRIQHTAELALAAGAVGVTLINTIGPSMVRVGLNPILSNRVGGLSGNAVRPLGLRAVESVRSAIGPGPVIIGMGGIGTAEHVLQFRACGADVFGVGSALTGLDSDQMKVFFAGLQSASLTGKPASLGSDSSDTPLNMDYHSTRVVERIQYTDDLFGLALADLPGDPAPGEKILFSHRARNRREALCGLFRRPAHRDYQGHWEIHRPSQSRQSGRRTSSARAVWKAYRRAPWLRWLCPGRRRHRYRFAA